jgi:hypothetical protein
VLCRKQQIARTHPILDIAAISQLLIQGHLLPFITPAIVSPQQVPILMLRPMWCYLMPDDLGLPVNDTGNISSNFRDFGGPFDSSWLNNGSNFAEGDDWDAYMSME